MLVHFDYSKIYVFEAEIKPDLSDPTHELLLFDATLTKYLRWRQIRNIDVSRGRTKITVNFEDGLAFESYGSDPNGPSITFSTELIVGSDWESVFGRMSLSEQKEFLCRHGVGFVPNGINCKQLKRTPLRAGRY